MIGIYVHIPFCRRRCLYCDFYSVGERRVDWPRFLSAVSAEASARIPLEMNAADRGAATLYIGGGTPSLIPPAEFRTLAARLVGLVGRPAEFTIEVNPDDVTPEKVKAWRAAGVGRVSMGVQSMVDAELRAIGRRHDSRTVTEAFSLLRDNFGNISLDLMFGLPGQTLSSLSRSLESVTAMNPEHVSVYSLMYEERTALTRLRDAGKLAETPEEDSVRMFESVDSALARAGYGRYEISNYARPGFRSRHNTLYWRGVPYIGLGPGAHSYDGARTRTFNLPDLKAYLDYWQPGEHSLPMPAESEILSEDELREEMVMTRLRTAEGLDLREFAARFGSDAKERLLSNAALWLREGYLTMAPGRSIALTTEGVMVSDEIFSSLF